MSQVPVALPEVAIFILAAWLGAIGLSARIRDSSRQLALDYGVFVLFGGFAVLGIWLFLNRDEAFFRELLAQYWLVALLFIFVLEGAMLLYFAPSESLVPIAVTMAETTDVAAATPLTYGLIIGTAVLGATVGQYLLFLLAERWGRDRLLERPWFRVSNETLSRFEAWFQRWGLLAVPVSNSLLFTRGMMTVPAGLAEMDERNFVVLSAIGTLSFEVLLAIGTVYTIDLFNIAF